MSRLKQYYPSLSMEELCELFGKSRQAWYKSRKSRSRKHSFHSQVIEIVDEYREDQAKIGTIKLQYLINKVLSPEQLSIGRDALYNLLRKHKKLIYRKKKHRFATTMGNGESIFPDRRKGLIINRIHHLWSSDITYLKLRGNARHCYGVFVIDEKSHFVVGHYVAADMTAVQMSNALTEAICRELGAREDFDHQLIFHTDRGGQFKGELFTAIRSRYKIIASMTAAGKSYENPVSERLNGILKDELMDNPVFESLQQARETVAKAVDIYNHKRPHLSCGLLTPAEAHRAEIGPLKKYWKQRKRKKDPKNES